MTPGGDREAHLQRLKGELLQRVADDVHVPRLPLVLPQQRRMVVHFGPMHRQQFPEGQNVSHIADEKRSHRGRKTSRDHLGAIGHSFGLVVVGDRDDLPLDDVDVPHQQSGVSVLKRGQLRAAGEKAEGKVNEHQEMLQKLSTELIVSMKVFVNGRRSRLILNVASV